MSRNALWGERDVLVFKELRLKMFSARTETQGLRPASDSSGLKSTFEKLCMYIQSCCQTNDLHVIPHKLSLLF